MKHYDDIDYDQFLYPDQNPDYQPDLHWNFLPASEIAKQAADNPPQHKILLAVSKVIADHRGWRNPRPYDRRMAKQSQRSRSN